LLLLLLRSRVVLDHDDAVVLVLDDGPHDQGRVTFVNRDNPTDPAPPPRLPQHRGGRNLVVVLSRVVLVLHRPSPPPKRESERPHTDPWTSDVVVVRTTWRTENRAPHWSADVVRIVVATPHQ